MEYIPARRPSPLCSLPTLAELPGTRALGFAGVTFINHPRAGYLTFCARLPSNQTVDPTFDSTVLVSHDLAERLASLWPAAELLRVDDPRSVFIDTLEYLQSNRLLAMSSLLPETCTVSSHANIGAGVVIEAGVQVDADVTIGSGTIVHSGTWLERGAIIGDHCAIGGTGINTYVGRDGRRRGFPHVAGVIIGEGASLGAGCVVARGILTSTRVGAGGIFGSMCNIGHGVEIGENVWMSVGTMIGGHTRIGARATIAMGCTIRDNITIGERASVGMGSVVTKKVRDGTSVFGNPARTVPHIKVGPAR